MDTSGTPPTPDTPATPGGDEGGHAAQRQLRRGAVAPLARDVVIVEGPDAETYLQGQLSANVAALAPEEGTWSLLLEPTGKVEAWLRVSRLGGDTFVIDVDAGYGPVVVKRLTRFLLRTAATVTPAPEGEWVALAVRGPVEVGLDHDAGATVLTLGTPWPGLIGWDVLAPASAHVRLSVPTVGADALEAVRVECGVPAMGAELVPGTIAAEVGQWFIDASVDFAKGCYVGQELVARIDSRGGNVPRRLRAVVPAAGVLPEVGDEVVVPGDGKVVGTLTSVVDSQAAGGPLALGYVGRAVDPPAPVRLRRDGHDIGAAEVRALPVVDEVDGAGSGTPVPVSLGP